MFELQTCKPFARLQTLAPSDQSTGKDRAPDSAWKGKCTKEIGNKEMVAISPDAPTAMCIRSSIWTRGNGGESHPSHCHVLSLMNAAAGRDSGGGGPVETQARP
jgi:hypothetical protein